MGALSERIFLLGGEVIVMVGWQHAGVVEKVLRGIAGAAGYAIECALGLNVVGCRDRGVDGDDFFLVTVDHGHSDPEEHAAH